jgi:glycosyltransferase involved in cell wall biosynthesis
MIIAIDGYEANVQERVGIGRYAYEIVSHMYALLEKNRGDTEVRVYLPTTPVSDMPKETPWWRYYTRGPSKLWTFVGLPFALYRDQPYADVLFSPTHYVPRFTDIPKVMAIMDLSYLVYPSMFRKRDLHKLVHWTKYGATHAERICTISEFSKNAIIKAYGIAAGSVVVTYPGFSMSNVKATKDDFEEIVKKYRISRHFILSVGTVQPRKNYERLIEAYAGFLASNKQKFGEIQLVIVGKKGWLYEKILEAPSRFGVSGKVKFLHSVTDRDLPYFYQGALCFALPSLYEGFGLPVLEAMAYKCPVVVSNVSSLPEIAGNAGVYVDPKNVGSITQGLLSAVRQRNLMQGRSRVQKGLDQVKLFTWEKAAAQTLKILEEVGGKASV